MIKCPKCNQEIKETKKFIECSGCKILLARITNTGLIRGRFGVGLIPKTITKYEEIKKHGNHKSPHRITG